MKCPFCASPESAVKDSRSAGNGLSVRRRRFCLSCGGKFTTLEKIRLKKFLVVKKNGNKREFDKNKIYKSISVAVRKRNIFDEEINRIVDKIEMEIEGKGLREISSKQIGELIMAELKSIDEVSYIRFASVYKHFKNAKDFTDFISKLEK